MSACGDELRDRLEAGEFADQPTPETEPESPEPEIRLWFSPFADCRTLADLRRAVELGNLVHHVSQPTWRPAK